MHTTKNKDGSIAITHMTQGSYLIVQYYKLHSYYWKQIQKGMNNQIQVLLSYHSITLDPVILFILYFGL